jgi:hypothetical protein
VETVPKDVCPMILISNFFSAYRPVSCVVPSCTDCKNPHGHEMATSQVSQKREIQGSLETTPTSSTDLAIWHRPCLLAEFLCSVYVICHRFVRR